jgi:uncharacterized protein (DUF2384 family)
MTKRVATKMVETSGTEIDLRTEKTLERAISVLGEEKWAKLWLASENRALGGVTPLSLLDTEAGYESVLNTLAQIEFGVIS